METRQDGGDADDGDSETPKDTPQDGAGRGSASFEAPTRIEDLLEAVKQSFGRAKQRLNGSSVPPAPTGGGRYEEIELLTSGGMGRIYRVRDRKLRRDVVMKVAREDVPPGRRKSTIARLLEEAQITGQLGHPGVLPVYDVAADEVGRPYFTMMRVKGRTLSRVFQRVSEERETLRFGVQALVRVCEAVAFAHSRKVIHRDLKPSNVMVGRFGEVYVLDWGLARVLDGDASRPTLFSATTEVCSDRSDERVEAPDSPVMTANGAMLGTPSYMSPEQAGGNAATVGRSTDIYSVGAMLYRLVTGEVPYGGDVTPAQAAEARLAGPPRAVREVRKDAPEELAEICSKAMADRPQDRYAAVADVKDDLEAWLTNRPVSAHDSSLSYQARLAMRRNRQLVLTVAAASVVLVLTSGALIERRAAAIEEKRQAIEERTSTFHDLMARDLPVFADELFPVGPELLDELESWLARAGEFLAQEASWREEAETADGDAAERLAILLEAAARVRAIVPVIEQRAALARRMADPTSFERDRLWRDASDRVASGETYDHLALTPIEHVVPLGLDPASGLEEFWVVGTGRAPLRDQATQELVVSAEDAIVLVLVPGGELAHEGETVAIDPFLIGKFEVTQAQWKRLMGDEPSLLRAGLRVSTLRIVSTHPVETIDWYRASEFARRAGLQLPGHLAWEWAALAHSGLRHGACADPYALAKRGNFADASALWRADPELRDDGFPAHAPAGSFPSNGFGLYDMLGNVSEWCSDAYSDEWIEPEAGRRKHFCGGSFVHAPSESLPGFSQAELPEGANFSRGLRVARPLDE